MRIWANAGIAHRFARDWILLKVDFRLRSLGLGLRSSSYDPTGRFQLPSSELYLKVVFKGKGGVSTGRLLAAVNRPH